ncbi:hypothetical protein RUM44_008481 [Polyplax serrata]|uniref:Uncharacterized protein n=1 Tax=Polyplax serrata TaxID=468196 RepID=A0ABR1B8F6_POLSC
MHKCRPCGCKGIRTCLLCEQQYGIASTYSQSKGKSYAYCYLCQKAWSDWDGVVVRDCPDHGGESLSISGIYVLPNFITNEEKEIILEGMNNENWDPSQSGRRKQNYGPKCNFKKRKIQIGKFNGFPSYSKLIHDKFKTLPILKNYSVIEQCTLEYDPNRGASIDPHIDDCWIWGERIVTVNVLGDTFLSLSKYRGDKTRYNLDQVALYPRILDSNENVLEASKSQPFRFNDCLLEEDNEKSDPIIRVFMPEMSLIILYGSARYEWEHCIPREDIKHLRICLAFREFTPPYLPGGESESKGSDILKMSNEFW